MTSLPPRLIAAALLAAPVGAFAEKPRDVTLVFAGGNHGDGATPALAALSRRLAGAPAKSTIVVFTGNYAAGPLPPEGAPGWAEAERAVLAHVEAVAEFSLRGGRVYFLPGDRDFAEGGTRAVRRLRAVLTGALPDGAEPMPVSDCGEPVLLELNKGLGLLLVNSQWALHDGRDDPDFNEACGLKRREAFEGYLLDRLRDYRDRRLVVACHHPLESLGETGGAFRAAAHASPIPVLGSAWVLARQLGVVPQYENHPRLHAWAEYVRNEADRTGSYVFASGHDPSLQAIALGRQLQLIAGTTGASGGPVVDAGPGDFALGQPGWVELTVAPDGSGTARAFGAAGDERFRAGVAAPPRLAPEPEGRPPPLPEGPIAASWSRVPVWQVPAPVQAVIGSFYSDAYALKLPYDVLDLATEQGGLRPYKIGGGAQTNSLRAHDAEGGDWAIRATTKDASRLLPYPFNQLEPVTRVLAHSFTATHPEGALAVPRLAEAVGLRHATPRLMYLPDQPGLGRYRGFITDEVVMLEQRPAKTKQYDEMVEKLLAKPWAHRVDQETMLRARLLDVLIGDWDRHRGQWRFAVTEDAGGGKTYVPIPLDRDQAFSSYDGLALAIARVMVGQARSLQPFGPDYGRLAWVNYNARDFDALMLNRLPRARWAAIAAEVQAAVTDAVIDEAFAAWHPEAFAHDGARIAAALKARRDRLGEAAAQFYAALARGVDVTGSAEGDRFDLWFEGAGAVRVAVRRQTGEGAPWFDRTFVPGETDEVRLYALGGDDVLTVHGTPRRGLTVRFVGGPGQDIVRAAGGPIDAPAIRFYDGEEGGVIDPSIQVSDERSNDAPLNQYEQRENHELAFGTFVPSLTINSDDGAFLGGTAAYIVPGFKKAPFGARHEVSGHFATAALAGALTYRGLFPQSAARLDQQLELTVQSPTYTRNFFGLGNLRVEDADSPDYYRVRQARYEARYGLSYGFDTDRTRIGAQVFGLALDTEGTPGRFVATAPDGAGGALGLRGFVGTRLFAETNTYDRLTLPRQGLAAHASVEARYDPVGGRDFSTTYTLAAAAAVPFDRERRFVLLTRARLEGIVGSHPFYFAPTVGELQVRGYHPQQLAGDVAFSQTTDLRVDVVRIRRVLPGTAGVHLSIDHGRVFGPSFGGPHHVSLGGGVWWSVVDWFGVSVAYHRGVLGGDRFSVAVGPLFSNPGF